MKCFPIADQVFNGVTGILIETRCIVHICFQGNEVNLAIVFTPSFHQVPKAIAGWQWSSHFFALVFANGFKKGTCPGSYGAHSTHSVSVLCSKYKLEGLNLHFSLHSVSKNEAIYTFHISWIKIFKHILILNQVHVQ